MRCVREREREGGAGGGRGKKDGKKQEETIPRCNEASLRLAERLRPENQHCRRVWRLGLFRCGTATGTAKVPRRLSRDRRMGVSIYPYLECRIKVELTKREVRSFQAPARVRVDETPSGFTRSLRSTRIRTLHLPVGFYIPEAIPISK